jgi:hypothetical protein
MSISREITVINGQFTNHEAQEILITIFSSKIQFHELKNLRSLLQDGIQDETAERRIPELKSGIDELLKIVTEANKNDKLLSIKSTITVSILDK